MTKTAQRRIASLFGVAFLVVLLALAIAFPEPTPFQYTVFRIVLALAAAGAAAMIPGFVEVAFPNWLRAGGALAVFVIVYFFNPAALFVREVPPPEPLPGPAAKPPAGALPSAAPGEPPAAPPAAGPPVEMADFSEELELREHGVAAARGVTVKSAGIEIGPEGATVQLGVSLAGAPETTRPYPEGAAIRLQRDGCEWLEVRVEDIRVAMPEGVTPEKLREMGDDMADEIARRSVALVVAGRCPA